MKNLPSQVVGDESELEKHSLLVLKSFKIDLLVVSRMEIHKKVCQLPIKILIAQKELCKSGHI
jgi:hypothetical protein